LKLASCSCPAGSRGQLQPGLRKVSVNLAPVADAIETERYDPSLPLAFKLARLFELPIEEIFEPEKE
jgi:hypothetical protein